MTGNERPPVMTDVARLAGVSAQTVSRVLNGSQHVETETRDRVLDAVRRLGYRRNTAARALRTQRSRTLGLIVADSSFYGPNSTTFALAEAARERGFYLSVAAVSDADRAGMEEAVDHLKDAAVEGIIAVVPVVAAAEALRQLLAGIAMIEIGTGQSGPELGISIDQVAAARTMTAHLVELGHQRIAHIAGPENWYVARARELGWQQQLVESRLSAPPARKGDWSPESGFAAAVDLLEYGDVTAIFAANDEMALGAMSAVRGRGIKVPEDVSVVGFDDISGAAFYEPPLTTFRQDFHDVGVRGIDALIALIRGDETYAAPPPRGQVIVRGSSAPPRSG